MSERFAFWAAAFGLWLLFFVIAWHTPVILDDWYPLAFWRTRELGPSAIWEYGYYQYFNHNPRVGDVYLAIVNGSRVAHLIATPLVQLAVPVTAFAIAFARWPRPTWRDLKLLLVMQTLLWLVIPVPGIIYFYRPFATNYLWSFTIMLALFVPYRIAMTRECGRGGAWYAPLMLVLGWLAGMGNEHTGPAAIVVMLCFLVAAWRRGRCRIWMLAGALGLFAGYLMLYFAPGQGVRYGGLAANYTPLATLLERGLGGCIDVVVAFTSEARLGIVYLVVSLVVYVDTFRRQRASMPALPRQSVLAVAALVAASLAIIVTLFASPTVGERTFYASGVLLVAAFAVIYERLLIEPRVRRFVLAACTLIFAYHAVHFVVTYRAVKAENDERMEILRATPSGRIALVPAYEHHEQTRWHWGDDFRYSSLRQYVGNEVFDIAGIELSDAPRWSQPSMPDRWTATRVFDPPLTPDEEAQLAPIYVPTYWEWSLKQFRWIMWTTRGKLGDHALVRYTIHSNLKFADPRPVVVMEWTPATDARLVVGTAVGDAIRVSHDLRVSDAYVVGCGKTTRVQAIRDGAVEQYPVPHACRQVHTLLLCEPTRCWLAGRQWR
jgi:hypothetical protein